MEIKSVYLRSQFVFFDILKYEIGNKVLIFVSILKLRHKKVVVVVGVVLTE